MYRLICWTHFLFPMVLLQHTCTIDIKELVPSDKLMRTNFIKKKNQPHMQLQNRETDYRYDSKQHSEQQTAKHIVLGTLYEN